MTVVPTTGRAGLALAGLLVCTLPALPATAGCGENSALGCGIDQDQTSVVPASTRSLTALLPLRRDDEGLAYELYAALVPTGYELPNVPQVAVSLTQVDVPRCGTVAAQGQTGPAVPCEAGRATGVTSWVQGAVSLRIATGTREGWYPLSAPVSSTTEFEQARASGQPAYLAEGGIAAAGAGWTGTATVGDTTAVRLDWTPGGGSPSSDAFDLAEGRTPSYSVSPIFTGADRWRTSVALRPTVPLTDVAGPVPGPAEVVGATRQDFSQRGSVRVVLSDALDALDAGSPAPLPELGLPEGRSLADLVVLDQTVPGLFREDDGLLVTQREALDDGDGALPPPPAGTGPLVAGLNAAGYGYLNPVQVVPKGGSLELKNLDSTEHNVASDQLGRDRRPLFEEAAAPNETVKLPIEELLAGTYRFYCTLHPSMQGQLSVQ